MADDAAGAVRRTPNPRRDDHAEITVPAPQPGAGATNTPSPVPSHQLGISSGVSSQDEPWPADPRTDPVGTVREHDDGTTAVKVAMGNDTGKGQHVWCEMTPDLAVRWLHHDEVAEWATEREARLAALRATIAADPDALFQLGHVHDTSNDMQAFLELPDCEACEGTGKDTHASPFEAPLAVHFAGPPCEIVGRRRQLCMWCGHVLHDSPRVGPNATPPWPTGRLVRVEDGIGTVVPHEPGDELPPGCCALPDDEPAAMAAAAGEPWCDEHGHPADRCSYCDPTGEIDESGPDEPEPAFTRVRRGLEDIADALGTTAADVHKGLRAYVDGALGDGPDEAQETRAAADWPAEPVDQRWDEQEADRG